MIKKYIILEDNIEIAVTHSVDEANTVVDCYKWNNPHKEYVVKEIQTSAVKPGFGRDPDLH